MKTAIVLQARMGSTRLPGKVLADIAGRPMLAHCIERLRTRSSLPIVVATTTLEEDDCVVEAAARYGAAVVRGSETDVLSRYALAASQLCLDWIIRATANNPLVDLDAPSRTFDLLKRNGVDYVTEGGLPHGAAVEAMRADAVLRAAVLADTTSDREQVTTFIRRYPQFSRLNALAPSSLRRAGLRLCVDTLDDLGFIRTLVRRIGGNVPASLTTVIAAADAIAREERMLTAGTGRAR